MKHILILIFFFFLFGCYQEQTVPVTADFSVTIEDADYSVPVRISLTNLTTGADHYQWTFEGGEPATADTYQPGMVTFRTAGTHIIRLEAWNDDQRKVKEFSLALDSALSIGFDVEIPINNISPVQAIITNTSRGAISWLWTFAGGDPLSSELASPHPVLFTQPGEHTIQLNVSNGREQLSITKTITVLPPMSIGFQMEPSFDDLDMEAPWTGTLHNQTVSGLAYTWIAPGGTITDPHAVDTQVTFPSPGTYTITLEAQNGKETQTSEQTIVVKANTNLYTETDVKLGCSTAHAAIGCFYSCVQRRVISQSDMSASPPVDLVFFGMGPQFTYCRFVSPDVAGTLVFDNIPGATRTHIANTQSAFSVADFDQMTTDAPLRSLNIRSLDTGNTSFAGNAPHIILFETATGRKGAIKIKGFIAEGNNSYILTDVKIMKN